MTKKYILSDNKEKTNIVMKVLKLLIDKNFNYRQPDANINKTDIQIINLVLM